MTEPEPSYPRLGPDELEDQARRFAQDAVAAYKREKARARELEEALASLTELSGDVVEHTTLGESPDQGQGPVVPGVTRGDVAAGQTDVDELLSGLGM